MSRAPNFYLISFSFFFFSFWLEYSSIQIEKKQKIWNGNDIRGKKEKKETRGTILLAGKYVNSPCRMRQEIGIIYFSSQRFHITRAWTDDRNEITWRRFRMLSALKMGVLNSPSMFLSAKMFSLVKSANVHTRETRKWCMQMCTKKKKRISKKCTRICTKNMRNTK